MAVTEDDVKSLMVTSDTASLSQHLATAQLLVTEELASSGLSSDRLDKITLFMAAHFAVLGIERGGLEKKSIDKTSESYHMIDNKAYGFDMTRFGRQVLLLDTTGTLADMSTGNLVAEFRVVGDGS